MGYERCICTHAEQAAIGDAARKGVSTAGSLIYITLRPCMNCVKLALSSGIKGVIFDENWTYNKGELEQSYGLLAQQFAQFTCAGAVDYADYAAAARPGGSRTQVKSSRGIANAKSKRPRQGT